MRPFFLISNDDGYQAAGLNFLIDTLLPHADLLVVAPDGARSGYGCAFSAAVPIRYSLVREQQGLRLYSCTGTPVDCVKLALNKLCQGREPDLIIGGINHGDNSSVNTHYSGTMGVASEGALQGYPSVAFSLCDHRPEADFTPLRPYLVDLAFKSITAGLPPFTCLNINFPVARKFKGVRVCRMALSRWVKEIEERRHPWGVPYCWLVGESVELEPEAEDTDRWALAHGYVAITPTRLDVTDHGLVEALKAVF